MIAIITIIAIIACRGEKSNVIYISKVTCYYMLQAIGYKLYVISSYMLPVVICYQYRLQAICYKQGIETLNRKL